VLRSGRRGVSVLTPRRTALSPSRLRAGAFCLCLLVLASCERRTQAQPRVEPAATPFFFQHLIDKEPPGGLDCCTDVAALADLNRDGFIDVVIGSEQASGAGLVWYEFATWKRHDIAKGAFTTDMEAVDFDHDGDADLVVGDTEVGTVWFENTEGRGEKWKRHTVGAGYVHDIEVADLNGDGRNDIVVDDKKIVRAFLQESSGTFTAQNLISRPGEGLEIVDLDADGDADVLYANLWLENDGASGWTERKLAPDFTQDTRIQTADLNGDGRLDVVLCGSEGEARVSWFEAPEQRGAQPWLEHQISAANLVGAHSLLLADFDLDGDLDVVSAEMHTSPGKRVVAFLNEGARWRDVVLARHGSHNMAAADLDGDGDADLVGKNYGGSGRFVELWENRAADLKLVPPSAPIAGSEWSYAPIDAARPKEELHKFGLLAADADRDGDQDVIAGGVLYLNPGKDSAAAWRRIVVTPSGDAIHATDHVFNGWRGLVAQTEDALLLLQATSADGARWSSRRLQALPAGRTQGFARTPPRKSGDYDFYFTRGQTLLQVTVPADPAKDWPMKTLSTGVDEAGVAAADLDSDGDVDIVTVEAGGHRLLWLENRAGKSMQAHPLGASLHWIDRVAVADIDEDGRQDVVFTEENRDLDYDARVAWLAAPADPRAGAWRLRPIVTLRSANSLDVIDFDHDGRLDIVTAEHTDIHSGEASPDTFTGVFRNRGGGAFELQAVEVGPHSSHLGALAVELSSNGQYDVVSVGWEQSCCVHRWKKKHTEHTE
jgi:hypothetical protein